MLKRLVTKKTQAAIAAKRWFEQYSRPNGHHMVMPAKWAAIHEALLALGQSPEPVDVDRVIGNTSWTTCSCQVCSESKNAVLWLGYEPDGEYTVSICLECAQSIAAMLTNAGKEA